ncbi:uncharacterized protein TNCV_280511 [Trichonephila clavipes]|nr:uncharacterized protein TNCV_280511 [Trichonephila clavipes]
MTHELVPPLLTTTPHQREDVSALDRFSMHRCPTRWVFSGTGLELVTKPATIRYLYHSAFAARTKTRLTFVKNFISREDSERITVHTLSVIFFNVTFHKEHLLHCEHVLHLRND